jgi:hypothetical protein
VSRVHMNVQPASFSVPAVGGLESLASYLCFSDSGKLKKSRYRGVYKCGASYSVGEPGLCRAAFCASPMCRNLCLCV